MPTAFSEGGWGGRGQGEFLSLGWKVFLEGACTQVGQRDGDVEMKPKYHQIIISLERTLNFTSINKRTSDPHSDGMLQEHFIPK